jgi:monoamine oxidase
MARTDLFRWLGKTTRKALGEKKITRREFLKTSLGAAAGLMAIGAFPSSTSWTALADPGKHASSTPVTIVGGGLGGLVTAYRLMQAGVPCEIYEASPRLGGRIFTRDNFNHESMFCELGGELIDTGHTDIIGLCRELDVPLEAFADGDAEFTPALYFSGGKIRSEAEVIEAFQPLAKALANDTLKIFPDGEIQIPTYREPCNAQWLDRLSLAEYLRAIPDLPGWLSRLIEAAYVGEYGLEANEQSALNLLLLIAPDTKDGFLVFGESDEAFRIRGGNSRLIDKLTARIAADVPLHTRQQLVDIREQGNQIRLTFKHNHNTQAITSDRVVLALPFSVLRTVGGVDRLPVSPVKKRCIQEFGYGTNSKQMMGFRSRFWRQAHDAFPASTGALFTDWPSQCYWETSRMQAGQGGILTNFLGGDAGRNARATQWKTALEDLGQLYKIAPDEFSRNAAFFNWSRYPHARGSYSCPKPGQYTSLMGAAMEPELNGRLFFAGEHCSVDWAGFMNGAAQSGDIAAKQILSTLQVRTRAAFRQ